MTVGVSVAVPEPFGTLLQGRRASFGDPAAHGIPTHITLLPPTRVDAADRPAIVEHLARVAEQGRPFRVRLHGTDTFRPVSPVVFVQVIEGGSACSWLQERVRDAEGPLSRRLDFPYHPHVTVAHGISEEAMDTAYAELADFEADWTAGGFALYEQGADCVWRLRREFTFGPPPAAEIPGSGARAATPPVAESGAPSTGPCLPAVPRQATWPSSACDGGAAVAPLA
ncbi:2'-5' RNA ligase family protein [Streptomyces sp. AJS327]|uniref:2'-5' RNA ligase family protein n=1 Tax=Streptomyces sp. AJS327 TaxID=2545265 RepID=UPI0015DFD57B|nr:2'-5' RNA ligase family protein [Streptomyces sp. AJS327]